MSITKSGIVNIFTSNTQQYELEKEMKKLKKIKALIEKRKTQMHSNREQMGHSKKSIGTSHDIKENGQHEGHARSKRLEKFRELTDHLETLEFLQKKYKTDFNVGLD